MAGATKFGNGLSLTGGATLNAGLNVDGGVQLVSGSGTMTTTVVE